MSSPTQRSLAMLRKDGWTCQIVERWNSFAHVRVDLLGVIDIVGIREDVQGVLGVQTTSAANISARVTKCLNSKEARLWVKCGNILQVAGWSKKGPRGKRKTWQVTIRNLSLEDFQDQLVR